MEERLKTLSASVKNVQIILHFDCTDYCVSVIAHDTAVLTSH